MRASAALLALVLAGCLTPVAREEGPSDPTYRVGGSFTPDASQEDFADFQERLRPWVDGPVAIMESHPAQYAFGGLGLYDCEEIRAMLRGLDYVATVGECARERTSGDPEVPASSSR